MIFDRSSTHLRSLGSPKLTTPLLQICLSEVSVLTTGKWPSVPSSPAIKLPMPIQRLMTDPTRSRSG